MPQAAHLRPVTEQGRGIVLPTLAIAGVAAAIGRGQDQPELGVAFAGPEPPRKDQAMTLATGNRRGHGA